MPPPSPHSSNPIVKASGKLAIEFPFAVVITAVNIVLVWSVRFLPVGYPVWLFEANVLREFSNPALPYSSNYEITFGPIPNLTFTVSSWLLSYCMPVEAAGKVFLTLCVIGLPWGIWYSVRALSSIPDNPLRFIGFPFAFNWLFFLSHNCLFGLVLLVWMVGYFFPRIARMRTLDWTLLAIGFILQYFSHGITYSIAILTFLGCALFADSGGKALLRKVLTAQAASIALLVWYVVSSTELLKTASGWGIWTVIQNSTKPLMLFLKTYGVLGPFPPTVLNGLWLLTILFLVIVLMREALSTKTYDKRFLAPLLFCVAMMLLLPDPAFGVDQPGVRYGLPFLILLVLTFLGCRIAREWAMVFLLTASFVAVYNFFYFKNYGEQAKLLYNDLVSELDPRKPSYTIALDWPAGTSLWDRVSPSTNALSGTPYYALMELGGVAEIPETGPVRMRRSVREMYPQPEGREAEQWFSSTFVKKDVLQSFNYVTVFGTGAVALKAVGALEQLKFHVARKQGVWTILESE